MTGIWRPKKLVVKTLKANGKVQIKAFKYYFFIAIFNFKLAENMRFKLPANCRFSLLTT